MTQKKAEILLAAVIAARATSLLFSKIAMNGMGIFNLLAARFLMAFVLLAVVFFKRLRHIKRHTLVRGATMGALFFLMLSTELTGLKSTPSSTVSLLENTAIILVPMAEAVLRHKLPKAVTAVSALVAIGGVALLTGQSGGFTPGMVLAVMAAVLREHISVMGMCGIALILLSLLVPQLWQLAEKKGITLLPRHAVPAVRRA